MRGWDWIPFKIRQLVCLTLFVLLLSGTGGILFSQVTANFTSNVTSGCSPVAVVFNSTSSTGTITSWFWDLGNGNTSTLQNPSDIYNTPGTYTVTLTVTGVGGSDTRTVVNYITVFQKPDVFIGATPTSGCVPLGVQFANNSIAYPGPFTSLIWDFGDGNTSNSANPFHTYACRALTMCFCRPWTTMAAPQPTRCRQRSMFQPRSMPIFPLHLSEAVGHLSRQISQTSAREPVHSPILGTLATVRRFPPPKIHPIPTSPTAAIR